jgi:hypothetical protein
MVGGLLKYVGVVDVELTTATVQLYDKRGKVWTVEEAEALNAELYGPAVVAVNEVGLVVGVVAGAGPHTVLTVAVLDAVLQPLEMSIRTVY